MKKLVFFSFLSLSASLFGDGLPNLSDRVLADTRFVDMSASFLYWHAAESIDWASTMTIEPQVEKLAYQTSKFGWDPGVRIGLGYNMGYDDWDSQVSYTWFQTHSASQISGDITAAYLGSKAALYNSYESASIKWALAYNILDLDLGRSFLVSCSLSLRPSIGLKGGWIDQTIRTFWVNPLVGGLRFSFTAHEDLKNNFSGGGPKFGLSGKWSISSSNFSLLGQFSGAFMWGHWVLKDKFHGGLTQVSVQVGERNLAAIELQALIGLGFDTNFNNDLSHFSLKIGYEIQDWFDQYQGFDNFSGGHSNDLILQGLSCDLRVDF